MRQRLKSGLFGTGRFLKSPKSGRPGRPDFGHLLYIIFVRLRLNWTLLSIGRFYILRVKI